MRSLTLCALVFLAVLVSACASTNQTVLPPTSMPSGSVVKPQPTTAPSTTSTSSVVDPLVAWCGLRLGEAKAEVLRSMGTPHGAQGASWMMAHGMSGDTAEWDNVTGDILLASFENGVTSNLQAYGGSVGPNPATNLSCEPFRH